MKKPIIRLAALLWLALSWNTFACDRECLRGHITRYLYALADNDSSGLAIAKIPRYTENGKEQVLGKGLWRSVTKLRDYRQDFIDEQTGMVGAYVVVEESGAPTLLVLRLKIDNNRIAEAETFTVRNLEEGAAFNIDGLSMPTKTIQYVPKPWQLNSREEVIRIASTYITGLEQGSFVTADVPFSENAYRLENGAMQAGPDCILNAGCKNIKTQKLGPGRTDMTKRLVLVDERSGIAWFNLSWSRGADHRLVVWEAFKIYDGKIHAAEVFMKRAPSDWRDGWSNPG